MAPLLTLALSRYYIKTHSGRVLARNRRFLRHRTPASLNLPGTTAQGLTNAQPSCEPHSPYTTFNQAVTSGDRNVPCNQAAHLEPSSHIRRSECPIEYQLSDTSPPSYPTPLIYNGSGEIN